MSHNLERMEYIGYLKSMPMVAFLYFEMNELLVAKFLSKELIFIIY